MKAKELFDPAYEPPGDWKAETLQQRELARLDLELVVFSAAARVPRRIAGDDVERARDRKACKALANAFQNALRLWGVELEADGATIDSNATAKQIGAARVIEEWIVSYEEELWTRARQIVTWALKNGCPREANQWAHRLTREVELVKGAFERHLA